jgi:hypothetical protein
MSESTIATLLVLAGIVIVMLMWPRFRRPRVHMINELDLMRLQDARRSGPINRPRWVRWVIIAFIAIVLVSLLWSLLR